MKDKYVKKYTGKEWNLFDKQKLINEIYETKKNFLEDYIEDNIDKIKKTFTKVKMDRIYAWLESDNDSETAKDVKEEIKLLLHNKRNMIS